MLKLSIGKGRHNNSSVAILHHSGLRARRVCALQISSCKAEMGLTTTFKEGIAVFVAIWTAGLTSITRQADFLSE